jgi:predicted nucleic acid-binding protein
VIVVDASFALGLIFNESNSVAVRAEWQAWDHTGEIVIAPALFRAETLSVVRRNTRRGLLTEADAEHAVLDLDRLHIEIREPAGLYPTAWELAKRYNRPTVYDCCYLALAALTGCDFWTADQRLVNAVRPALPWIHAV